MKKFTPLSMLLLFALLSSTAYAQPPCTPTSTRPVFGTVNIASGTVSFTNMPTGNVIQVNCPVANTQYFIDGCGTNSGTVSDGTNDGSVTFLDANAATANSLGFIEDGCTNVTPNGWGPPSGSWTAPSAGTFFIYLTEWSSGWADGCVADGVNNAYDFVITVTAPPSHDVALDSAYLPSLYTCIALPQMTTPFAVGARVRNVGVSTASSVSVDVRITNLTTSTVVSTQTLTGTAPLASGATVNLSGTAYAAPAVPAAYEFRYISHMTPADVNSVNDTAYRYIVTDSSLLAEDYAILFNTIDNPLGVNVQPVIMGQKFQFTTPTSIDTIRSYFIISVDNVGDSVQAVIYNTVGGLPTTLAASSPIHVFTVADTGGVLLPFAFSPNFNVSAGTYFIGMKQINAQNFGLAQTDENYIAGNALYALAPFTSWTPIENDGFPGSFLIWVNTKLNCNLAVSGTPTGSTCGLNNGAVTLNITGANGALSYAWSNGATTASVNNVAAGQYSVTVSSGGCTASATATVANTGTTPAVTLTTTPASCGLSDGSVSASVSGSGGPYSYSWDNGGGNVSSISGLSSGSYSVTVTDGNCTASSTAFVANSGGPTASATNTNVSCHGGSDGSATVTASGGTGPFTYAWSNSQSTATISSLAAGSYSVTVTDQSSCVATASVTVSEPAAISAGVTTTPVSCFDGNDGSAGVSASGGTGSLSYDWGNNLTTAAINNLSAGTYCVTVTDANNCSVSACQSIANPAQLTANITSTAVGCHGGNNASALVTASGGAGSFTYLWSNNLTTAGINSLTAGNYSVTVSDANNCTASATTSITEPTALAITAACNPTVLGQSTGSATANTTGGTLPYYYNWSNGAQNDTIANLSAGVIHVTVTDANSCTASADCEVQFTTGLDEVVGGIAALNIYPNPSTGMVQVDVLLQQASKIHLTISDTRGALVTESHIPSNTTVHQLFDLSTLAKGVYHLKITTEQGTISRKIVLQ